VTRTAAILKSIGLRRGLCWTFLVVVSVTSAGALAQQYDVVVYGGTSAAVTAAVEVARSGKSVVIISPDQNLGGMSANGLGWTDIGNRDTIGGLSREFYHRVYDHYLDSSAWTTQTRQNYINNSSLDPDTARQMMFTFEPKVAKQIFTDMVTEANVPVVSGRLDRSASGVMKSGNRITSIRTTGGATFTGKAFIDATYEGDLMAAAGVSYTVGREANSQYGETLNGIQTARATKNQLPSGIDPYVVAGNPASGLLPGVNATAGGADGSSDKRLQAYTYRMVMTNNAANRVPVPQPANYNEANYELLFRAIAAGQTGSFFKLDPMPNNKTDSNNASGMSTDFIGGNYSLTTPNWNYAEADYATRDQHLQAARDWQMGLVYALQHSTRVPASIRNSWSAWGLPADEFTDNGNWPNDVYVREARRMVGDVVITEKNVNQVPGMTFSDSVGLGGYNMDSHNVQRYVTASGIVQNEGDIQVAPANGPYPISYRAMVPRVGEADNLLVPAAVSASHIAYGSIRLEPVFMTLGQSAGAAAVVVSESAIAARDVPYPMLRSRLVRDEQMLGASYVSPDAGVLFNFGALVANDANSPGHALGGIPGAQWNLVTGDTATGIKDSKGNATNLTINLGKSAAGQQVLNWNAAGFATATGTALNTGLYAGNVRSALFVNDGSNSQVDIGVRISGLSEGNYDAFVTAKNTNTTTDEQYNVYSMLVDPASADTDYSGASATTMVHGLDAQWQHRESVVDANFQIIGQKDLVIVVEGVTPGELRGFLNTLEIVKLSGVVSADVDHDGDVDLNDFAMIQQYYLSNVVLGTNGDANSDGIVDQKDFFFWRETYLAGGGDATAVQGLSVAEPSTAAALLGAFPLLSHLWARLRMRPANDSSALPVNSQNHTDVGALK
jgi:hypothetical protein